ncbi:MAG TPA: immunoglobulin-like domain-containing protein [Solirubrobacterales bacterium]|nr:immunoglobulin-like domain-containing protein [Solirubrobacterales bacterium]
MVSEARAEVDSVSARPTQVFGSSLSVGTYRVDFKFYDKDGATLGEYFEYVQVVPRSLKPKLTLRRTAVSPGGRLWLRLENLGTRLFAFGLPYELQRYEGGRWQQAPQRMKFFAPKITLAAGHAAECQEVPILKQVEPGLYRVRKEITYFVKRAIKGRRVVGEPFFVRP